MTRKPTGKVKSRSLRLYAAFCYPVLFEIIQVGRQFRHVVTDKSQDELPPITVTPEIFDRMLAMARTEALEMISRALDHERLVPQGQLPSIASSLACMAGGQENPVELWPNKNEEDKPS